MDRFWERKALFDMTDEEWECLCDGCGKCCLVKLQDEDDGRVYYTDVACRYLDPQTARCQDYKHRQRNVPSCLNLTVQSLADFQWLPRDCAYRRLAEGRGLASWHPLVSGDAGSTRAAGCSVAGRCVSESNIHEDELVERLIHWVDE